MSTVGFVQEDADKLLDACMRDLQLLRSRYADKKEVQLLDSRLIRLGWESPVVPRAFKALYDAESKKEKDAGLWSRQGLDPVRHRFAMLVERTCKMTPSRGSSIPPWEQPDVKRRFDTLYRENFKSEGNAQTKVGKHSQRSGRLKVRRKLGTLNHDDDQFKFVSPRKLQRMGRREKPSKEERMRASHDMIQMLWRQVRTKSSRNSPKTKPFPFLRKPRNRPPRKAYFFKKEAANAFDEEELVEQDFQGEDSDENAIEMTDWAKSSLGENQNPESWFINVRPRIQGSEPEVLASVALQEEGPANNSSLERDWPPLASYFALDCVFEQEAVESTSQVLLGRNKFLDSDTDHKMSPEGRLCVAPDIDHLLEDKESSFSSSDQEVRDGLGFSSSEDDSPNFQAGPGRSSIPGSKVTLRKPTVGAHLLSSMGLFAATQIDTLAAFPSS